MRCLGPTLSSVSTYLEEVKHGDPGTVQLRVAQHSWLPSSHFLTNSTPSAPERCPMSPSHAPGMPRLCLPRLALLPHYHSSGLRYHNVQPCQEPKTQQPPRDEAGERVNEGGMGLSLRSQTKTRWCWPPICITFWEPFQGLWQHSSPPPQSGHSNAQE